MKSIYSFQKKHLDIEKFLYKGGILLRQTIDKRGEFVVEKLSMVGDWNVQLICESTDSCKKIIDRLVSVYPTRFRAIESSKLIKGPKYSFAIHTPTKISL